MQKIILASQSPRRKQLLEWAEIEFDIVIAATDESFEKGMMPADAAVSIAYEKASVVLSKHPDRIVLAADTIVVIDGRIIGKPTNREDALRTLGLLNGRKHEVITGVAILWEHHTIVFSDSTLVQFHSLTATELEYYVDRYQPYDKAGAYAIQEWIGVRGIRKIEGDFYNVMGLPVSRVVQALEKIPGI